MTIKEKQGFTLVEVLVAIVVLSVGVLAWTVTQNSNVRSRAVSTNLTAATDFAQSLVENLTLNAMQRSVADGDTNGTDSETVDSVTYNALWGLTGGDLLTGGARVWKVDVVVTWTKWGTHSLSLQKVVTGR